MEIRTSGYSIWLEPEGVVKERLNRVIQYLSKEHGTPAFGPHVTLIGGLEGSEDEIRRRTESLANKIEPYSITFTGEVGLEEIWQKAMFIPVQEDYLVMAANRLARAEFSFSGGNSYHPHLSLMYSNDIPLARRLKIVGRLNLADFNGQSPVSKIHLYQTEGKVEEWVKLAQYPLQADGKP